MKKKTKREPCIHRPHTLQCREIINDIIDGRCDLYIRIEDDIEALSSQRPSEDTPVPTYIHFSVLTDKCIEYDSFFFSAFQDMDGSSHTNRILSCSYRPYFISFVVDAEKVDPAILQHLSSDWHSCRCVLSKSTPAESDHILIGMLVTSASPVSIIQGFKLEFTNKSLPSHLLDTINRPYNPALLPLCRHVNQVLQDAWDSDTLQSVDIYNVGKGNADYIRGSKRRILYDIGYDHLLRYPSRHIDQERFPRAVTAIRHLKPHCVILSHWDLDHIIGCAYAPQRIFAVKWIAPTLDAGKVNAIRLARYLNLFHNLCLVDRTQPNKLIAQAHSGSTSVSLWLGQGNDHRKITKPNCEGLVLEINDHHTNRNFLFSGDVPYVCMPYGLFNRKTYHFLHVPHHCSSMTLSPLARCANNMGTLAVITSYNVNDRRCINHDQLLRQKYDSVLYVTDPIPNPPTTPATTLGIRFKRPFLRADYR